MALTIFKCLKYNGSTVNNILKWKFAKKLVNKLVTSRLSSLDYLPH